MVRQVGSHGATGRAAVRHRHDARPADAERAVKVPREARGYRTDEERNGDHGHEDESEHLGRERVSSATVATILMRPAEGVMEIAPLPALGARFTRYALASEPARAAAE